MSTTRMCDSQPFCVNDPTGQEPWRRIFSELADGWSTGSFNLNRRNKRTGRNEAVEVDQDVCPDCMDARFGTRQNDAAEAAREAKLDPAYIDWLERQTKVGPYRKIGNGE